MNIIVDLDGTIALCDHRRHLIKQEGWDAFYRACEYDKPNWPVINLLHYIKKQPSVFRDQPSNIDIFSGRSDIVIQETLDWLRAFGVPHTSLRMRKNGDFTPDEELKLQWYKELTYPIDFVIDDRNKVVKMWREQGLTCFQVAEGNF